MVRNRKFAALVLAGAIALSSAGCNIVAGIATADNALASLSKNSIPTACGIIGVAEGYFHQLEPRISQANIDIERKAAAAVKVICDNPPTNTAEAFSTLLQLWLTIQTATKA